MLFTNVIAFVAFAAPILAFSAEESTFAKREARMALAKARVARHARRAEHSAASQLVERASYNTVACPLSSFRNQQGRADQFCKTYFDQPATKVTYNKRQAVGFCNGQTCEIMCNMGLDQSESGNTVTCTAPAGNCGGVSCIAPNSLTEVGCVNNRCAVTGCANGSTLSSRGDACYNLQSDTMNCGATGNRCRASYDRKYSATCVSGRCNLACPSGFRSGMSAGGYTCIPRA